MVHIFTLGGDARIDQGGGCHTPSGVAVLSLWPIHTRRGRNSPSNDRSLRDRDPNWGVRDLEVVAATAHSAGFSEPVVTEMPANNLSAVFPRM
jgi:Protein of unknown function (DUF938)